LTGTCLLLWEVNSACLRAMNLIVPEPVALLAKGLSAPLPGTDEGLCFAVDLEVTIKFIEIIRHEATHN